MRFPFEHFFLPACESESWGCPLAEPSATMLAAWGAKVSRQRVPSTSKAALGHIPVHPQPGYEAHSCRGAATSRNDVIDKGYIPVGQFAGTRTRSSRNTCSPLVVIDDSGSTKASARCIFGVLCKTTMVLRPSARAVAHATGIPRVAAVTTTSGW
jgi:hypothetical protein